MDPEDLKVMKPVNKLKLGKHTKNSLYNNKNLNDGERIDFIKTCRRFLITACNQLKNRLNLGEEWLTHGKVLNPRNALSKTFHRQYRNLNKVYDAFPYLIDR